jgi:hypothetical protein
MLSRPTTEQILLDCCTQLREKIAPALADRESAIAAQMLEEVLRNCAVRAAHEIAWMREESDAMLAFAREIGVDTGAVGDPATLHLDDVVAAYGAATATFESALDTVLASGDAEGLARAQALLDQRLAHENEIMGEWGFVGRA